MKILNKKTDTLIKGAVNVARPSLFGNPFKIDKHGSRDQVIEQYRTYFKNRVKSDATFRDQLSQIMSAPALVCWCAPEACHAEVIRDYLMGLKAKAYISACPNGVEIGDCWGENKTSKGGFEILWSVKGVGHGVLTFYRSHNGQIMCDNELMGRPFIKKILARLVDETVMKEPHEKDKK